MGRPVMLPDRKELGFAASGAMVAQIWEKAAREETTPSEIIRRALRLYLADNAS